MVRTVGIAVWTSREFKNSWGIQEERVGSKCRDGLGNTWGGEIVGWKIAEVEKEINILYCWSGCKLNEVL